MNYLDVMKEIEEKYCKHDDFINIHKNWVEYILTRLASNHSVESLFIPRTLNLQSSKSCGKLESIDGRERIRLSKPQISELTEILLEQKVIRKEFVFNCHVSHEEHILEGEDLDYFLKAYNNSIEVCRIYNEGEISEAERDLKLNSEECTVISFSDGYTKLNALDAVSLNFLFTDLVDIEPEMFEFDKADLVYAIESTLDSDLADKIKKLASIAAYKRQDS